MHLSFSISPDRKHLTIHADADARAELRELPDTVEQMEERGESVTIHSDDAMYDAFERLICNSELQWIAPEVCGDLTDAPILGILGETEPRDKSLHGDGAIFAGCWQDETGRVRVWVEPVLERWGFLDYQLRSPLFDLLEKGEAIFTAP